MTRERERWRAFDRRPRASERTRTSEQGALDWGLAEGGGSPFALDDGTRLRLEVLEALPCALVVTDREERVLHWSRGAEELYGVSAPQMSGRPLDFAYEERWPSQSAAADVLRRIRAGQVWRGESVHRLRDGQERVVDVTLRAFSRRGRPDGLLRLVTDVTAERVASRERMVAERMEAVGRLAGGIAHDFNNLLMGILGCVRIARDTLPGSAPASRFLEEIRAAAERGADLTRDLLLYSRRAPGELKPLRLAHVVEGLQADIQRRVGESVLVRFHASASGGPVIADALQVETLLTHLCDNAFAAMPEGGVLDIEVDDVEIALNEACAHDARPGPYVRLVVRDSGHGIAEDARAKLYEPFFTTRGEEGAGLGLSIVYGIIKQLGGFIQVESEPGRGASFALHLPRNVEREVAPMNLQPALAPGAGETILVVEDDPLVRMTVQHFLCSAGYRVLEAGGSDEALEVVRRHEGAVDLLVTDMVLPGMSGRDLSRQLRVEHPALRVIFMSAYPNDMLVEQKRLDAGVPSIEKPFTEETLVAKVHEVLRGEA